ncbi:MAG: Wax ester synthase/acyl-CoA:diacylglycerol acyltransferase, partial [uncultured Solirubrobacteraceae bacterium]
AAADESGRAVPGAGDAEGLRPRLRPGDLRPVDLRRQPHVGGHVPAGGRAHPSAAPVPLEARRGAVRPRPPVLGRGRPLRPRLPHPRDRGAAAGRRPPARRRREPHRRAPARPRPPVVGALRHPGPLRRPRRDLDEDPPRGGRRRLRRGDPQHPARPRPQRPRHPAGARVRHRRGPPVAAPDARARDRRPAAPAGQGDRADPADRAQPRRAPRRAADPGSARHDPRGRDRAPLCLGQPGRRDPRPGRPGQRPAHALPGAGQRAPALQLRPALARPCQGDQERARHHGQRRRRRPRRHGDAAVAPRPRRAARGPARRDGPRLRAHARADGHLRQPGVGDDHADPHRRGRPPRSAHARARGAAAREEPPQGAAGDAHAGRHAVHPAGDPRAGDPGDDARHRRRRAAAQPRDLERAGPAGAALQRGGAAAQQLPRVGDHRRRRAQHHVPELHGPHRLRDRGRPRHGRRRVAAHGRDARRAVRARHGGLRHEARAVGEEAHHQAGQDAGV